MKTTNTIMSSYGTNVFTVMSQLAFDHDAINLGQGFPDQDGPLDIREKAAKAMIDGPNQYPPMMGMAELRQAVAAANKRFYGLEVDWTSQVMVTSGATEAIADCLLGLINPGDEVVMIEPLYDCYLPMVQRAGGVAKLVRIEPPEWQLPRQQLADAFSDKTKLILLNSPHNPAGKVFDLDELTFIADLVKKHDAYAVCDEVYEHLLFDGRQHIPLMTLPGMAERTLRIGSAGKTFSLTGWKIGYITGAPALLSSVAKTHQYNIFTTPPGTQLAVAFGLTKGDDYFTGLAADLQARRDQLSAGLEKIGFKTMVSEGTYFLTVDFRPLLGRMGGFNGDDVEFCQHITTKAGVGAVPVSAFYQQADVDHFVRFCFCKGEALLDQALERLSDHFST